MEMRIALLAHFRAGLIKLKRSRLSQERLGWQRPLDTESTQPWDWQNEDPTASACMFLFINCFYFGGHFSLSGIPR
jgi:hypothetical protein